MILDRNTSVSFRKEEVRIGLSAVDLVVIRTPDQPLRPAGPSLSTCGAMQPHQEESEESQHQS